MVEQLTGYLVAYQFARLHLPKTDKQGSNVLLGHGLRQVVHDQIGSGLKSSAVVGAQTLHVRDRVHTTNRGRDVIAVVIVVDDAARGR